MDKRRPSFLAWFEQRQVTRIFAYYAALAVLVLVLYRLTPNLPGVFSTENFAASIAEIRKGNLLTSGSELNLTPGQVALDALLMMLGGVLLMLPVAWVHVLTRSRKGFSQSMVQTLIILPVVVAGVLTIVQHSVALAFGLGGVVGAVSFRNRLADPKDAIYIFVAIAVGLAAGVEVLSVAAAISIFFNLVVLTAWWSDFGRMPASLEAGIAERRLERVKSTGAMPTDFLKLVDQQLLRSMTPDQLQAIAERAADRRRKAAREHGSVDSDEEKKPRFDAVIRVTMQPGDAAAVRQAIEPVLSGQTKRWVLEESGPDPSGLVAARYRVKFGKSMPSPLVVEAMRRSALPKVVTIDVQDA